MPTKPSSTRSPSKSPGPTKAGRPSPSLGSVFKAAMNSVSRNYQASRYAVNTPKPDLPPRKSAPSKGTNAAGKVAASRYGGPPRPAITVHKPK